MEFCSYGILLIESLLICLLIYLQLIYLLISGLCYRIRRRLGAALAEDLGQLH